MRPPLSYARQSPNTFGFALAYSLLYVLSVRHGGRELLVSRDEQLRHMLQEVLIVGENLRVVRAVLVLAVIDEEMVSAIVHEVRVLVETDVVAYLLVAHETERHVVDLRQTVRRAQVEFVGRESHLAVAAECSRICSRHLSRASIICWNSSAYCSGLS